MGTLAVRLLHKPSQRPVTDAVIVHTRIVMVHEGGTDMNAAFDPLGSPKPGVYAFRASHDGGKIGTCLLRPRYRASPKLWSARLVFV